MLFVAAIKVAFNFNKEQIIGRPLRVSAKATSSKNCNSSWKQKKMLNFKHVQEFLAWLEDSTLTKDLKLILNDRKPRPLKYPFRASTL